MCLMKNLLYEPLPDFVTIAGKTCPVVTDFREWIKFHDLLRDKTVPEQTKIFLLADWFLNPPAILTESHLNALLSFYQVNRQNTESSDSDRNFHSGKPPVFDWCIDASFVTADFRRFYQLDLLTVPFLHWFAFYALFEALPEESMCQKRMYYRSVSLSDIKDKNEKKRIRKIKRAIAIPYTMSDEEIAAVFSECF